MVTQSKIFDTSIVVDATANDYIDAFAFEPFPADAIGSERINFTISKDVIYGWRKFSRQLFNGSIDLTLAKDYSSSNVLAKGVWNGTTDLDAWMQSLTTSLTNELRTGNSTSRAIYDGHASQLGVHSRRAWFAIPCFCTASPLALLVVIILRTARRPVMPWKSNILTYVLFGCDEQGAARAAWFTDKYDGIETAIEDMPVQVEGYRGGVWKFKSG